MKDSFDHRPNPPIRPVQPANKTLSKQKKAFPRGIFLYPGTVPNPNNE